MSEDIVKKGTPEFKAAYQQYLKLFFGSKENEYLPRGTFEFGENKGKCLGHTSKKILEANLPKPFGCSSLFIQPCMKVTDKGKLTERTALKGVVWFCDRVGYICTPCREDFTKPEESHPKSCPPPEDFEPEYDDDYEKDWEEMLNGLPLPQ